jgi:hypothetical protein
MTLSMNYNMPYQQCQLFKLRLFEQQTSTAKEIEFRSLQKECNLFETSGVRLPNLDMLLSALRTIQPTSSDSERVFSVAGNSVAADNY